MTLDRFVIFYADIATLVGDDKLFADFAVTCWQFRVGDIRAESLIRKKYLVNAQGVILEKEFCRMSRKQRRVLV